jgi:hypothetical protein
MVIESDGKVGIGTASPSSLLYLEEDNTTNVTDAASMISNSSLTINGNSSDGSDVIRMGAMSNSSGDYFIEVSNAAGNAAYNLLLNPINGGKVGIGTASPTHKLSVEGDATDGGTGNDGQLVLRGATNTNLRLMMGMDTSNEYGFISPMKLGTAWHNLSLCYNGGNVGIGDNSPATKLDVNGDIQIQGANAMILNHTTGAASDTYINSPSSDVMAFRTGGTERMRIDGSGNVGIGHNSPQYGLTLAQGSADANKIGWEDGSNNKRGAILVSDATDDMHFHIGTSDYTYMRANTSGFVGIGNNVDAAKLLHLRGADATLRINDSTGADWSWDISVGVTADRRFAIKDASGDTEVFYINGNSNDAYFKSSGNSNRAMEIAQNWNGSGDASTCLDLSIGNTNKASYLLRGYNGGSQIFLVTGNNGAVSTTAGTYGTIGSDLRLKENINNATSKLADLNALSVKNFNFIGSEEKYIGFIAQEFEEVFPNLVTTRDTREYDEDDNVVSGYEDTKGLKVGMEFAILVKAIQELSAKVEELEPTEQDDGPVNSVKERVNSLEARVNELENG